MAVQGVIIGSLKTSLKKAVIKTVKEQGKKALTQEGTDLAKKIAKEAMDDGTAVLLNRLKKYPTKKLFELVKKETGLSESDLKKVLKNFNQTEKQKKLATGKTFVELGKKALKKKIGKSPSIKSIKDLYNQYEEYQSEKSEDKLNKAVYNKLQEIERYLTEKIYGLQGPEDQYKKKRSYNTDLTKYFDGNIDYYWYNLDALDTIIAYIEEDMEYYSDGTGGDIVLIEISKKKWEVHEEKVINRYISEIKSDVRTALKIRK